MSIWVINITILGNRNYKVYTGQLRIIDKERQKSWKSILLYKLFYITTCIAANTLSNAISEVMCNGTIPSEKATIVELASVCFTTCKSNQF